MDAKFDAWYAEQSRKGDPERNPHLLDQAFAAGRIAERESELAQMVRNSATTVGEVVVTTNENGQCVAVTRQDQEGKILSLIWKFKGNSKALAFSAVPEVDPKKWKGEEING